MARGSGNSPAVTPRLVRLLLPLFVLVVPAAAPANDGHRRELPLGPSTLEEARESTTVAPGVQWTQIVRGRRSPRERFVVEVLTAADRREARVVAERVRRAGFPARVERFAGPLGDDRDEVRVWVVRSGAFADQAAAGVHRDRVIAAGFPAARAVYTGDDGKHTSGPWRLNVLSVRPERIGPVLANDLVLGRETTSQIAQRTGAPAGVNGGYFVIGGPGDGDPAGTFALDGRLISETIDGRTNLLLSGAGARLGVLSFSGEATIGGAMRELDGVDRVRGQIRNCGGVGGDVPTEQPLHDVTCTDASELVLVTPRFGATTATGPDGVEAIVRNGLVTELREGGSAPVPADGYVLSGSGDGADFLRAWAEPGARPALRLELREDGTPLPLEGSVVNGGPALVRDGRFFVRSAEEGFLHPGEPGFYYSFGIRRNPRTLAGIRADGTLLLVTIDGRQPDWSVGASFAESADVMQALGARQALNLDGGGSTTFTVGGTVVNRPSDATGERPVSDGLFVMP
jgi:Phosphodiester glycosidase